MLIEELLSVLVGSISTEKAKIKLVLDAVNDWPQEANSIEEFLEYLKADLKQDEITIKNIVKREKQLSPDKDAWKMESYASILELLKLCDSKSLNVVLSD